jgi:hypothetical protein
MGGVRDKPEMEIDSRGQVKPKQKYLSPPGRGNMLYQHCFQGP